MNKVNYLLLLEQGFELVDTLNEESCDFATTHHISEVTGKKTNIVNHHLNNLFKEGELIKINSKPVYYLPKQLVSDFLNQELSKSVYDSFEELLADKTDVFDQLIGSQSSLNHVIKQ